MSKAGDTTESEYLVQDSTCRGCRYYGHISGDYRRCCEYTLQTGKIRHNPPGQCEVKDTKKRTSKRSKAEYEFFRRWEAARRKR